MKELFEAIEDSYLALVKKLYEQDYYKDVNYDTALIFALKSYGFDIVKFFIDKGAFDNANEHVLGETLMVALKCDNIPIVKLLLDKGASINYHNKTNETPLLVASYYKLDALNVLINMETLSKATIDDLGEMLIIASYFSNIPIIKILLDNKANINFHDESNGYTPLLAAIINGNKETLDFLITNNALDHATKNELSQMLILASTNGNLALIETLLNKGADINYPIISGETPISIALSSGKKDILNLFINKGALTSLSNTEATNIFIKSINVILNNIIAGKGEIIHELLKTFPEAIPNDIKLEIIDLAQIYENKAILEIFGLPTKPLSLQEKFEKKINFALTKSPNLNKYAAIVNIMNNAGIKLPQNLNFLINNYRENEKFLHPEIKKLIISQVPKLARIYCKEALYQDLVRIGEKFKIGKNNPIMLEIKTKLEVLYSIDNNRENFALALEDLKIILIKERIKHSLHNELNTNDQIKLHQIIDKSINNGESISDTCENIQDFLVRREVKIPYNKLRHICSNFVILRPIHNQDTLHKRMTQNVLNKINEDFRIEASAAADLRHTKMTGNEILYRGMSVNFSNEQIKDLFENGHRKLSHNTDLLLYDKQVDWKPQVGDWEGNAVYMSYNSSISKKFTSGNGIMIEYRPKAGELGIEGSIVYEREAEILFNHLPGEDIKAIYKIEDEKIIDVFLNPYYEERQNEPELSFNIDENLYDAADKYAAIGKSAYEQVKFNKNRDQYISPQDFNERYGMKEVEQARVRLWDERGYRNYKEKFDELPNEAWPEKVNSNKQTFPDKKESYKINLDKDTFYESITENLHEEITSIIPIEVASIKLIVSTTEDKIIASSVPLREYIITDKIPSSTFEEKFGEIAVDNETAASQVIARLQSQGIDFTLEASSAYEDLAKKCESAKVPLTIEMTDSYRSFINSNIPKSTLASEAFDSIWKISKQFKLLKAVYQIASDTAQVGYNIINNLMSENITEQNKTLNIKLASNDLVSNAVKISKINKIINLEIKNQEDEITAYCKKANRFYDSNLNSSTKEVTDMKKKYIEQYEFLTKKFDKFKKLFINEIIDIEFAQIEMGEYLEILKAKTVTQYEISELNKLRDNLSKDIADLEKNIHKISSKANVNDMAAKEDLTRIASKIIPKDMKHHKADEIDTVVGGAKIKKNNIKRV